VKKIVLVAAVLLIAAVAGCTGRPLSQGGTSTVPEAATLASSSVANIAESYIEKYFAPEGEEVKVTSVWEEHGVYGFNVSVGGYNYTSYITKDGKLIFPTGFYTDKAPPMPEQVPPPPEVQGAEPEQLGGMNE